MTVAENVRSLAAAARPAIRAWLEAANEMKDLRQAASDKGIDWTALKALLVAQERDAEDGGERLKKLLAKLDISSEYADMIVAERQKASPQLQTTPVSAPSHTSDRRGADAESQLPQAVGASATNSVSGEGPTANARQASLSAPIAAVGIGAGDAAATENLVIPEAFRREPNAPVWQALSADQ